MSDSNPRVRAGSATQHNEPEPSAAGAETKEQREAMARHTLSARATLADKLRRWDLDAEFGLMRVTAGGAYVEYHAVVEVVAELLAEREGTEGILNDARRCLDVFADHLSEHVYGEFASALESYGVRGTFVSIHPEWLEDRARWSLEVFGPGARTKGVCAHLRKEVDEAEANPSDASEWADIILLALDGASRAGISSEAMIRAVLGKHRKNTQRRWPDWRGRSDEEPIEHDRTQDGAAAGGAS